MRHRGGGRRRMRRPVVVVAVRRSTSTCAQWTATRGEVEMLQGGTGGGEDWGRSTWPARWPTPAVSAVTARKQRGDGGDGKLVNNSNFQNFFL